MSEKKLTLKDLKPVCFLQAVDPVLENISFRGNKLQVNGKHYRQGYGLRSGGRIGFDLSGCGKVVIRITAALDDESKAERGIFELKDAISGEVIAVSPVLELKRNPIQFEFEPDGHNQIFVTYGNAPDTPLCCSIDLFEFEVIYTRRKPELYFPCREIGTKNLRWLLAPEYGGPCSQHGIYLRGQMNPETEKSPLVRSGLYRAPDPADFNLPPTLKIILANGAVSLELAEQSFQQRSISNGVTEYVISQLDKAMSIEVKTFITAYENCDIFKIFTQVINHGRLPVTLLEREAGSVHLPIAEDPQLMTFRGKQYWEHTRPETYPVMHGTIKNMNSCFNHNSQEIFPGCYVSCRGKSTEDRGTVFGAMLGWDGNWSYQLTRSAKEQLFFSGGAQPDPFILDGNETFTSPEMLITVSGKGNGGVSRNFHKYMREHNGIANGQAVRRVVLNSWEGFFLDFDGERLKTMIHSAARAGAELFVLDDGWFGEGKYARNQDNAGLGDWVVNCEKLPGGLQPYIDEAIKCGMDFGLWVEPEMVNSSSNLYEQHPDWITAIPDREIIYGRGKTQLLLDLTRKEVEEFVYNAVASLLKKYPAISYIKWDHNLRGRNQGAAHLGIKQSMQCELHTAAFHRIMKRLRAEFPGTEFQSCASGGGRTDCGTMQYFEEFWCSDNSQAYHRVPIQWAFSHFYPAKAMASHISKLSEMPSEYKFRVDVAMSARLGIELYPPAIDAEDAEIIRRGVSVYKELRDLIHNADLWRGRSPHASDVTEMTFVAPDQAQAVLFGFKRSLAAVNDQIKAGGLKRNARYKVEEVNPDTSPRIDGVITLSGAELMQKGITVKFPELLSSAVFLITEITQ